MDHVGGRSGREGGMNHVGGRSGRKGGREGGREEWEEGISDR